MARERAPVVLIRLWDGDYFSAGEKNPDPGRYEEWSPEHGEIKPRRPTGLEALDNSDEDPPVLWDVRLSADRSVDQAAFRSCLEGDPRTLPVPGLELGDGADEVRVLVRVSTQAQARALAAELASAAEKAADLGAKVQSSRVSWCSS